MLQELWKVTSLSHFFTCSICCPLSPYTLTPFSPSHTMSKGLEGWWRKHRRQVWAVQPDQEPVVAGTSFPHHQSKGLLCSWLYSILSKIISMAEVGQKQRHSGLHLTVGTTLQETYEPRDAVLTEWQEAWAALPDVFLWLMLALDDASWNSSNWIYVTTWKIFYCSFLSEPQLELNMWTRARSSHN